MMFATSGLGGVSLLHLVTPLLASPQIQTVFMNCFGDLLCSVIGVSGGVVYVENVIPKPDTTPIVVVIACLTSDSESVDIRVIVKHLHCEYPHAPLFIVVARTGANVVGKYLGKEGEDIPIAGVVGLSLSVLFGFYRLNSFYFSRLQMYLQDFYLLHSYTA